MAGVGVMKLLHDPTELITRAVQPVLWLCIFGEAMSQIRAIPTQGFTYLQFITPGVLTQSVTFVAIFYGLDIIMERDTGLLQKILSNSDTTTGACLGENAFSECSWGKPGRRCFLSCFDPKHPS